MKKERGRSRERDARLTTIDGRFANNITRKTPVERRGQDVGQKVPNEKHNGDQRRTAANRRGEVEGAMSSEAGRTSARSGNGQLYGIAPVLEVLRAGSRPIERILIADGAHQHRLHELLELARRANVPIRRAPRAELERHAAGMNHQGVIASVAAVHYRSADELLDELAARTGTDDPPLAVVLDGIEDPHNLGAIIRTAECAGVHAVFVPERRAAGLTETVAKAAAGALEYVHVARATNTVRLIEELKERNIWTVGTATDAVQDYTAWDWTMPCAIVFGGEGAGLRRLVRERCDALVRIPLRGRIESLNVSVAAGVLLYEVVRQRAIARHSATEPVGR